MKTVIFLLITLQALSLTLSAPLKDSDVDAELKQPGDGLHNHEYPAREGKWNFNYEPGYIHVHSVTGNEFSIGHKANIEIGIQESKAQLVNPAPGLSAPALGLSGCPDNEIITTDCMCGGRNCAKGSVCSSGSTCIPVCDPGPYELKSACFCKNTKGGGTPCDAELICQINGICKSDDMVDFPCWFPDSLLYPEVPQGSSQGSTHNLATEFNWTDTTVQYYYSEETTWEEDKQIIREVMNKIEDKTCFQFQEGTKPELEKKHSLEIFITDKLCPGGCGGSVGIEGGDTNRLKLSLTAHPTKHNELTEEPLYDHEGNPVECRSKGLILHELMHVLGVGHTQTRSDRDDYITVFLKNIRPEFKEPYEKCENCALYDSIPYECDSLMHYGTHFKGKEVIKPHNTNICKLKEKNKFLRSLEVYATEKDWELLNIIGKCFPCSTGQVSKVCWCKEEGGAVEELCDVGQTCTTGGLCTHSGTTMAPTVSPTTISTTTAEATTTQVPCEVNVGTSDTNKISATVSKDCACPEVINKSNWLVGQTSHDYSTLSDEFAVTQDGSSLEVQRTDSNDGWSMDLTFMCNRQGNGEKVCEGHGYDKVTCASIGCCQFDDGQCWSSVGQRPCWTSEKKRKRSTQAATVSGKIVLPEDSNFTFPSNSQVHVSCDDISTLHSTNLGSTVVDVSNKPSKEDISYTLDAEFLNSAKISMSATINMGWTRDPGSKEWIRRGDLHSDVIHLLSVVDSTVEYEKDIEVHLYD